MSLDAEEEAKQLSNTQMKTTVGRIIDLVLIFC